ETGSPVVPVSRVDGRLAAFDPASHTIAVELHLVQPFLARRRLLHQRRELGFDKGGERCFYGGADARGIKRDGLFFSHRAALDVLRDRFVRMPHAVAGSGDFFEAAAGRHTIGLVLDDGAVLAARELVGLLDQQPGVFTALLAAAALDEHPAASQLFAVQLELEPALLVARARVFLWLPGP